MVNGFTGNTMSVAGGFVSYGRKAGFLGFDDGINVGIQVAWKAALGFKDDERKHADKANWMPTRRNKFHKIDGYMAWLCAHCVSMEKDPAGVVKREAAVRVYSVRGRRAIQPIGRQSG